MPERAAFLVVCLTTLVLVLGEPPLVEDVHVQVRSFLQDDNDTIAKADNIIRMLFFILVFIR